jgi:hypothetical protein
VHRGVYRLDPLPPTVKGQWMAAALACGSGAVLSHRSAAAALDLGTVPAGDVEITAEATRARSRIGIRLHNTASLPAQDTGTVDGIPCASPARTLVDLAEVLDHDALARALEQAEKLRLLDVLAIEEAMSRLRGRRGITPLRQALAAFTGPAPSRSELERRFLLLCHDGGLPIPEVNVWLPDPAMEVDFLWRDVRLLAETDGRAHHGTAAAFQRDRQRDRALYLAGYVPLRFTWQDVFHRPAQTAGEIAEHRRRALTTLDRGPPCASPSRMG